MLNPRWGLLNSYCNPIDPEDTEDIWIDWTGLVAFVDILGGRSLYYSDDEADKEKLRKFSTYIEEILNHGQATITDYDD